MRNLVIFLIIVSLGILTFSPLVCSRHFSHVPMPGVIMEVADPSLEEFAPAWQQEIGRRFPNAVGILCHGGDFIEGEWIVSAKSFEHHVTMADLVRHYQAMYPDRTIVVLACNPGHLRMGIPGVYYAHSSVWCVPDRALTPDQFPAGEAMQTFDSGYEASTATNRWASNPDVVGNIFEFIKD
jgi:hypothetical protein